MKRGLCWFLVLVMLAAMSAPTLAAPSGHRVLPGVIGGTLGDQMPGDPDEGEGITRTPENGASGIRPTLRAVDSESDLSASMFERWWKALGEILRAHYVGLR